MNIEPTIKPKLESKKKANKVSKDTDNINLDERYIEANKALEAGDLVTYTQIQKNITRFPIGAISPNLLPDSDGNQEQGVDAFRKILDSSALNEEDPEIKKDISLHME